MSFESTNTEHTKKLYILYLICTLFYLEKEFGEAVV